MSGEGDHHKTGEDLRDGPCLRAEFEGAPNEAQERSEDRMRDQFPAQEPQHRNGVKRPVLFTPWVAGGGDAMLSLARVQRSDRRLGGTAVGHGPSEQASLDGRAGSATGEEAGCEHAREVDHGGSSC